MESPSEKDLLQGARAFDMETLAYIYDSYSPALFRYAARMLDSAQLGEDCVSETFSRFLSALRQGKGPEDYLRAYLFRTAHNWITDYYRSRPHLIQALEGDLTDKDHVPLPQDVEKKIQGHAVVNALAHLTSDQRQVIVLRFLEGWEIEEVARALEKPPGAIKALQHRALAKLRQLMQGKEEHEDDE